jgi:tetratricopeptide (TPR) repeat protein
MSTKRKNSPKPNAATANTNTNALEAQVQIKFQQAITNHQNGQIAQAQALYENILTVQPRHFDALHLLGVIASQMDHHQKAVELMSRAIAIHPGNPSFYSNRGVSLQKLKQLDAAVDSYDQAIRLKPDYALAYFNRGVSLHELKRLEAAVASYEQAIDIKPDYAEAHASRGNALTELKQLDAAIASYDQAIRIKPDYAEAHANRGFALQEHKQLDAAIASYDQAIGINRDYAQAHYNRGNALKEGEQFDAAVESYERAISIQPDYAEAYANRGAALKEMHRLDAAVASYEQAIRLKPDYAQAWYNRGVLLKDLNHLDAAIASYDCAIKLQPDYPDANWNKAFTLLLNGNFAAGWDLYEWRWINEKTKLKQRDFSQPLWLGKESLAGNTILLHNEQGLGDAIQFVRYAKLASDLGARVIVEIPASLIDLFKGFSGVGEVAVRGGVLPEFDYHCPLLSLPLAFNTDLQSIPAAQKYISPDRTKQEYWSHKLGAKSKPRVGLVWSGNANHTNDLNRSALLADLLPHLPSGIQYISLQKEVRDIDLPALESNPNIMHMGDELQDFTDTAALCGLMDLVISVDTSVAHLSGVLEIPTWIALPFSPDWRWLLNRDDSPWYPSVKLYRQPDIKDWGNVFAKIGEDLLRFVRGKTEEN